MSMWGNDGFGFKDMIDSAYSSVSHAVDVENMRWESHVMQGAVYDASRQQSMQADINSNRVKVSPREWFE